MKVSDSGMPEEAYWESLFDIPLILDRLGITAALGDVAEVGCGYGTFTIPVAARIRGQLTTCDIEPAMVERTRKRAAAAGLHNVRVIQADAEEGGFGTEESSQDGCLLFNILHGAEPLPLLAAAARVLRPGGRAFVIHWRGDIETPRGPERALRPSASQVREWGAAVGDLEDVTGAVDLPPWHCGVVLQRR